MDDYDDYGDYDFTIPTTPDDDYEEEDPHIWEPETPTDDFEDPKTTWETTPTTPTTKRSRVRALVTYCYSAAAVVVARRRRTMTTTTTETTTEMTTKDRIRAWLTAPGGSSSSTTTNSTTSSRWIISLFWILYPMKKLIFYSIVGVLCCLQFQYITSQFTRYPHNMSSSSSGNTKDMNLIHLNTLPFEYQDDFRKQRGASTIKINKSNDILTLRTVITIGSGASSSQLVEGLVDRSLATATPTTTDTNTENGQPQHPDEIEGGTTVVVADDTTILETVVQNEENKQEQDYIFETTAGTFENTTTTTTTTTNNNNNTGTTNTATQDDVWAKNNLENKELIVSVRSFEVYGTIQNVLFRQTIIHAMKKLNLRGGVGFVTKNNSKPKNSENNNDQEPVAEITVVATSQNSSTNEDNDDEDATDKLIDEFITLIINDGLPLNSRGATITKVIETKTNTTNEKAQPLNPNNSNTTFTTLISKFYDHHTATTETVDLATLTNDKIDFYI